MNEVTLPPGPNWYLSTILACANDGTVAWGSRNAIVIVKHVSERRKLDYSIITDAQVEKVNSLAFSPEYGTQGKNLLVSGGDEHIIRIWDLDNMTAVSSQSYSDTKQKVIGVDWSKSDPTLVCCISTEGSLIAWNTSHSVCQTITLGKMTATCIACCPHRSNTVAVGTKSGLIYVINLQGTGNITYKMRGHDTEITSLSWCPSDVSVFNGSISKDLLLASGAKDKSIFIWRAGGDGRYEIQLALPNSPLDSQQHRVKLGASAGNFTVVSWIEPKYLLVSSVYGELLRLDLSTPLKKPAWKLIQGKHGRGLFSIANMPMNNSDENWRNSSKPEIWTTAQDRQLICTIIEGDKSITNYNIPTHAGYIYCIAACPLDTSRIAYGGGDALLRLWNLSESHEKTFDLKCLWQRMMGRITAIAWHPEYENILAFGTGEGRIGIHDTSNISKPPVIFRHHHRRTVYSLGWAENLSNGVWFLYSCGDHELIYYNHDKPHADPTVLIKKDCTEFRWNPDSSCMAIGYEDGSISFVKNNLQPCGRSIFHLKKAVQCLAWHPHSTATDVRWSPLRHYLAVATNANAIAIFDMTDMMDQLKKKPTTTVEETNGAHKIVTNGADSTIQHKLVGTLVGHIDRVVCLAWSPHFSGHLVSGSYDNTAQVWNVETQELIGTYTGHCGPIFSCMWSPSDPDLIITGSVDCSLRIWRLSEQKIIIPKGKLEIKKSKGKKNKKKNDKVMTNGNLETITNDIAKVSLTSDESNNDLVPLGNDITNGTPNNQELKESNNKEKRNKNKKGSYFATYRKTMSDKEVVLSSCLKLARKVLNQRDNETASSDDGDILSIFGTKEDISKIISIENTAHVAQGQHTMVTEMNIWNNNLRQQLEDAAKELRLNDFLVSLAPSLSVKMWQTMCETYATQLIRELNPTKAVCYLLCIHKIHRAIEVFMESKMYREAYVLAKCKLDTDDAILNNILEEWTKTSLVTGQFEEAAQCYIQLGDITKAAKILARRKDVLTLETAAHLAILAHDENLSETILDQAVTESLLHSCHQNCHDLIIKFPIIQYRSIHIKASEELKKMRKMIDESHILSWLNGTSEIGLLPILNERHQEFESSEYNKLAALTSPNLPENKSMLWMMLSREIALAIISPTNEMKVRHIVSALGMISQYEVLNPSKSDESHVNFLIGLLSILDAKCFSLTSILQNDETPMYKSLRAYTCLGLLNWLLDRIEKQPNSEIPINVVITAVEATLIDGLDQSAVRYWTLTSEISKLEALLGASMGNSQKDDDEGQTPLDPASLLKSLEEIRAVKEKFITERVCAPTPILIYSKAIELSSVLTDKDVKERFTQVVAKTWKLAVS